MRPLHHLRRPAVEAISLGVLLAAASAALPADARNFANVSDRWMQIGTTPEAAIFMLLPDGQTGDSRSVSVSLYFFDSKGRPELRNYRNARGTATLDCKNAYAKLVFNQGVRLDGQVEAFRLPSDMKLESDPILHGALLRPGCGLVKPSENELGTLRAWEATTAYALRDAGRSVRKDPELPERCAVLHRSTTADPFLGTWWDIYITRELDFQTVHPGPAFKAYVQGKTGDKDAKVVCDLVDPNQPETDAQWLERVLGDDGRRGTVVDNSWRP